MGKKRSRKHSQFPYPRVVRDGHCLLNTRVDNGGWAILVLDGARVGTTSLNGADNFVRLLVAGDDFTEDDVLAIQPRGDDGGDEELGAIAGEGGNISSMIELHQCHVYQLTCSGRRWPWTA